MNEMTFNEFRANLPAALNAVEHRGETVIVTRRGKPVAHLVPIPQEPAMASTITTAAQWADALDAEMSRTGQTAGDLISFGYANGQIAGVSLDPGHPAADDERGVIASDSGWIVGYDAQSGYWTAR